MNLCGGPRHFDAIQIGTQSELWFKSWFGECNMSSRHMALVYMVVARNVHHGSLTLLAC